MSTQVQYNELKCGLIFFKQKILSVGKSQGWENGQLQQ